MKIALIRPGSTYADWYKRPPSGIMYLYESLVRANLHTNIFDAYFYQWDDELLCHKIFEYSPDIIGISSMTHEISRAAILASKIKKSIDYDLIAIVGGCHVTALPVETIKEFSSFDYGVIGEGELTIVRLVDALKNKRCVKEIPGIVFRDENSEVILNIHNDVLSADLLNQIPVHTLKHYYGNDLKALKPKNASHTIFSSRGCPYNCVFCMQVLGRKVRYRSIDSIIDEIKYVVDNYGAHTINFSDEIFLFNNQRTKDLLNRLIDEGISDKIKWSGQTRANMVTSEIIKLAKKSGCYQLGMGVESGNEQILKKINKKITISQIYNAVNIIKKANIELGTYFILGHPGETEKTAKETCDLAIKLNTNTIAIGLMVPYPGTAIYDMALNNEQGYTLLSKKWDDYDKYGSNALMIHGIDNYKLNKLQRSTYLKFYIKNFRILDLFMYTWSRRRAFLYFLKKKMFRDAVK